MFRRNKKKKDNKSADTIALTSPQVESSSGVEPIATKSKGKGGFLGRRKKKAAHTNTNNNNNFVRNSSKISSNNDTNPTISDSSIKNDVSSNNKRQIETGSIAKHDIIIPESTAVSINKRSTSSRNSKKSTALPQQSTTQKIQQSKSQSSTKKSNSIPPPISDTNRGKPKKGTVSSSTAKSTVAVPTSNQQPQAAGSIQNNNHINNNSNSVPMTRSGWSMLSNESTAMNSENYIESLDNLSVRSGKVSFFLNDSVCIDRMCI